MSRSVNGMLRLAVAGALTLAACAPSLGSESKVSNAALLEPETEVEVPDFDLDEASGIVPCVLVGKSRLDLASVRGEKFVLEVAFRTRTNGRLVRQTLLFDAEAGDRTEVDRDTVEVTLPRAQLVAPALPGSASARGYLLGAGEAPPLLSDAWYTKVQAVEELPEGGIVPCVLVRPQLLDPARASQHGLQLTVSYDIAGGTNVEEVFVIALSEVREMQDVDGLAEVNAGTLTLSQLPEPGSTSVSAALVAL